MLAAWGCLCAWKMHRKRRLVGERVAGEEVYHGTFLNVRVQTVERPQGGSERYEIVEHRNAVAIVALRSTARDDPNVEPLVALVRQLRPAIGAETWEIPAGLVRDEELSQPQRAAERELREETGANGGRWRQLTIEYPSPGFSTEWIAIYLAEDVSVPAGAAPADPNEIATVHWVPLSEAVAMCASGAIVDGKTQLGLTLARDAATLSAREVGGTAAMPLDPTNVPFTREARYRDPADIALEGQEKRTAGADELDTSLSLQDMLLEEFNYANVTAYQAMEDRARLFNNYLVIAGGGAAGIGGVIYQLNQSGLSRLDGPLSAALLFALGLLGVAFFTSLTRLRQTYGGSILAMNTIKEFYIAQFEETMPLAKYAFLWRMKTIRPNESYGSVTFVKTTTVGLIGSLCFGGVAFILAAIAFAGNLTSMSTSLVPLAIGGAFAIVSLLLHIASFRRMTNNTAAIEAARKRLEELRQMLKAQAQPGH
jgi:ADP-ribose pyrophosphatase